MSSELKGFNMLDAELEASKFVGDERGIFT